MAYFKRETFSGIAPGVSPRLLAEEFAQTAQNIDFESGRLSPITDDSDSYTLQSSSRNSIFYYNNANWLEWNDSYVKAAEGPIASDTNKRVYWSGEGGAGGYPRMGVVSGVVSGSSGYPATSYRLGVPAPTNAPSVSKSGTASSTQDPYSVSYVYTLVTVYGEEGPPSAATTPIDLTDDETVTVTMASGHVPSGNYNFGTGALKRIYRSNTGSTNTTFQFVGSVAIAATSFSDTTDAADLGEVLPSDTWIGPPDDDTSLYPDGALQGLTPLSNGVFAGFSGKRLCLSEPYLPHAWPVAYRIPFDEDIVAIGSTSDGAVALTDGHPYFITGVDPSAMTAVKLDLAQACVNRESVVDMGDYLLYAAPDGLVAVTGGTGRLVTQGQISVKQWNASYYPTVIRAFEHEGTYVAFWSSGGSHGGWIYDPRNERNSLSTITSSAEVRGGYMNPKDGQLYTIVANKVKKYRGGTTNSTLTWKSKKFVTPKPVSMAWISVHADTYPVTVKVWADGTLTAQYTLSKSGSTYTQATTTPSSISNVTLQEPVMRLPATIGQEWEIEVSGAVNINEVCLAQSMAEIRDR